MENNIYASLREKEAKDRWKVDTKGSEVRRFDDEVNKASGEGGQASRRRLNRDCHHYHQRGPHTHTHQHNGLIQFTHTHTHTGLGAIV